MRLATQLPSSMSFLRLLHFNICIQEFYTHLNPQATKTLVLTAFIVFWVLFSSSVQLSCVSIHSYDIAYVLASISFMLGAQTLTVIFIALTLSEDLVYEAWCVSRAADTPEALKYTGSIQKSPVQSRPTHGIIMFCLLFRFNLIFIPFPLSPRSPVNFQPQSMHGSRTHWR